ncbi:hypothetical protein PanWU01x14_130750 [Parasponia andersonii]|uniref:Uncharacterized protein n=1 Tax=Parasponia andersonii TaxID=3476 RepID=A0A2P5CQV0_PARAD|nr:hypothetical protein PanWU01x14_130750 [Parasponia andersonii]
MSKNQGTSQLLILSCDSCRSAASLGWHGEASPVIKVARWQPNELQLLWVASAENARERERERAEGDVVGKREKGKEKRGGLHDQFMGLCNFQKLHNGLLLF